jgi:asparagine synthase (glutamine-hydrolysing)
MFAFAVWDAGANRLTLARDRVGIKPLYFTRRGGAFLFASEIKALLAHPDVTADIAPAAMYHYLTYLAAPAPLTMFDGIYKLPAASSITVDARGRMTAGWYWSAEPGRGIPEGALDGLSRSAVDEFYTAGVREGWNARCNAA